MLTIPTIATFVTDVFSSPCTYSQQNHSKVPEVDEDWPSLQTIISFRDRVRARLVRLYEELDSGKVVLTRNIARTLVMTHEHEGFHIEVSSLFSF
jgi:hypothetical protein